MFGLFAKKSAVGLDLGHHTLMAVQVERSSHGWKVTRSATCATPPETIKDGVVIDTKTLGQTIKKLLKDGGISASTAYIAAAGGAVFVRPVNFPKMPEATLRKSIRFEAGRYVPGSVDDSFVEFEIIGPVDETQMSVLIVAAPKDIVQSRITACEEAGLDVEVVDVESFAAYRALVEADPTIDQTLTTAVLDIGANSTTVSVTHEGVFVMNRSIPQGSRTLTEALKSYFKLTDEDAESGKSQLDARDLLDESTVKENPPLRVIQPHLDDLIREVRRSLNYFQLQNTEAGDTRKVQRVVVAGGGAKLPGLAEYLTAKLGIEVLKLGVYDNPRFTHSGAHEDDGLDLAVAVGLAMRAHTKALATKPAKPLKAKAEKPTREPKPPKPPKPGKAPKAEKPPRVKKGKKTEEAPPAEVEVDSVEAA